MTLRLNAYLMMNGTTQAAIKFYEEVLDAKVTFLQTFGEMPAESNCNMPEEAKNRVMHAAIKIGDSDLFFSDTMPGQDVPPGGQVTLCISSSDSARSRQIFEGLQEGGQVIMPLQETFFSPAYGMLTDQFGITFQVYTEGKKPE